MGQFFDFGDAAMPDLSHDATLTTSNDGAGEG
jgi:hypothetical protein